MKTVLSVKDFAIIYGLLSTRIEEMRQQERRNIARGEATDAYLHPEKVSMSRVDENLKTSVYYCDLLKIAKKIGQMQVETTQLQAGDYNGTDI